MSEGKAAAIRAAFDWGFAEPLPDGRRVREEVLLVRMGDAIRALRLGDLVGVYADRIVTPVPSAVRSFLGLLAFRGALVPVYDLAVLFGLAVQSAGSLRWVAMLQGSPALAVAFERLEERRATLPERGGPGSIPTGEDVVQVVRVGEVAVPILAASDLRARLPTGRRASGPEESGAP